MSNYHDYVFVLWGDQFEEAAVTIFVSELREVGLRVKVVGLTSRRINGMYGLALIPDLTLDQALRLANRIICLIIPYTSPGLTRLKNDPRLRELCRRAYFNNAKFVIGHLDEAELVTLDLFPIANDNLLVYPPNEDLVIFARQVARLLSSAG